MSGVGVVLCLTSASGCTVDTSLVAISDASGEFTMAGIPPGTYVVLYSPTGAPGSEVDGLHIDLDADSADCLGEGFLGSAPQSCQGSIPFFSSDTGIKLLGKSSIAITSSGPSLKTGTVYSPKLGLCLNFESGSPLSATITAGGSTSVEITDRS